MLDWAGDDVLAKALGSRSSPSAAGAARRHDHQRHAHRHQQRGFQHTAPVGTDFQGGPVINGDGKVLGIASLAYQPRGSTRARSTTPCSSPTICQGVLECGGGIKKKGNKNVPPAAARRRPRRRSPARPCRCPAAGAAPTDPVTSVFGPRWLGGAANGEGAHATPAR